MHTWWTGLADAPPMRRRPCTPSGWVLWRHAHSTSPSNCGSLPIWRLARIRSPRQRSALGLAERAAGRLLHACAALGLVQVSGDVFRNTPLTQQYLVEGRPTFIGSYLQMFDTLGYHRWEQMGAALRQNGPVDDLYHPYHYLADDAEAAQTFSAAQHAGSRSLGHALARRVDFTPFTCLLDLGGGSGAYTVEILHRYPHLRAILVDFPQVCRLAEEVMRAGGTD